MSVWGCKCRTGGDNGQITPGAFLGKVESVAVIVLVVMLAVNLPGVIVLVVLLDFGSLSRLH